MPVSAGSFYFMGKKSKIKQIRRIASQMPVINQKKIVKELVPGSEAIKSGVKEVDGKPVDEHRFYEKKYAVAVPVNHNRQMKKLYNKMGGKGVGLYMSAVQKFSEQNTKQNTPTMDNKGL
jgi:hypothetical protein